MAAAIGLPVVVLFGPSQVGVWRPWKTQSETLAGADGNDAVITSGLATGQVVVTAGVHVLNPGQKVKFYVDPTVPSASAASGTGGVPVGVK